MGQRFEREANQWIEENLPSEITTNRDLRHKVFMLLEMPGAHNTGPISGRTNPEFHTAVLDEDMLFGAHRLMKEGVSLSDIKKIIRRAFADPEAIDPITPEVQKLLDNKLVE